MTHYTYPQGLICKYTYHKDGTKPSNPSAIFVFGSNLAGRHGAGAAKAAMDYYGAVYGVALGITGQAYAIPTKDANIETLELHWINFYVLEFLNCAKQNPTKQFFMTRIGCVLAGYANADIAPMFKGAPQNIDFPEDWKFWLEP